MSKLKTLQYRFRHSISSCMRFLLPLLDHSIFFFSFFPLPWSTFLPLVHHPRFFSLHLLGMRIMIIASGAFPDSPWPLPSGHLLCITEADRALMTGGCNALLERRPASLPKISRLPATSKFRSVPDSE